MPNSGYSESKIQIRIMGILAVKKRYGGKLNFLILPAISGILEKLVMVIVEKTTVNKSELLMKLYLS